VKEGWIVDIASVAGTRERERERAGRREGDGRADGGTSSGREMEGKSSDERSERGRMGETQIDRVVAR